MQTQTSVSRAILATVLLAACTVLGLAGIDLVLPAIPVLPAALGGSLGMAQLVLASFATGVGLGLLLFGELGARFNNRKLLALALLAYGVVSWFAAAADTLQQLIALRFVQGIFAACAAVVAPGMVRVLFAERDALRALGVLGSVESLAPAIAPVFGVWLLAWNGWQASFHVTAVVATLLSVLVVSSGSLLPAVAAVKTQRSYGQLLTSIGFQRYAFGQGCAVGGLLVFVFGMPVVITTSLGGELDDFIIMQMSGITTFIIAANLSHHAVARFGGDRVIAGGTLMALLGALALCAYGWAGGTDMLWVTLLFLPLNMGIGFRGPPAFYAALAASRGDDARAAALVVLFIMLLTAAGTALVAPFITAGLVPITVAASLLLLAALLCTRLLPPTAGA